MRHPIDLGTRIRYELVQHAPNGETRTMEQGEAIILSSLYNSQDMPMWAYNISPSGVPVLTDEYPFEIYPDEFQVYEDAIQEAFDEASQQWHFVP